MTKSNKFSPEVRERAVRMMQEHRGEYPSQWAAIESIAPKFGCVPQALHKWVKRHEIGREEGRELAVRGLRDRRLSAAHRGLAGQQHHAHGFRSGCLGANLVRPCSSSGTAPSSADSDRGRNTSSIRDTELLAEVDIELSVGSKGDSYDNARAETINGLYKAELIHQRAPWRTRETLVLATLEWVSWFNHHRLLETMDYIPTAEAEASCYR